MFTLLFLSSLLPHTKGNDGTGVALAVGQTLSSAPSIYCFIPSAQPSCVPGTPIPILPVRKLRQGVEQ